MNSETKRYLKKNEILIVLQAVRFGDINTIMDYLDDEQLKDEIQTLLDENRFKEERDNIEKKYLANLVSRIKEEDYEILESKIKYYESLKLICATGKTEYIKKCISTLNLDLSSKVFLVSATKDEQYIMKFFYENKDKLENWQKANLIKATENKNIIDQCINDESLELTDDLKADLIASTKDEKYIKYYIEHGNLNLESICMLIGEIKDAKYVVDKIEDSELQIPGNQIVKIVKKLNNQSVIDYYFNSTKLEVSDKLELLETVKKPEYIEQFILNNIDTIDRDSLIMALTKVIVFTNDIDDKYKVIFDETLGLSYNEKIKLLIQTKDKALIEKYAKENPLLDIKDKKMLKLIMNPNELSLERATYKKIDLPNGMTIGIEIESEGEYSAGMPKILLHNRWKSKPDGSLENGIEVVSTILSGSDNDSREIYQICDFLGDMGQSVSERCGAHVHIGADYLKNKQAYINLLEIYGNCEELIYVISNESNSAIRTGISKYCLPLAKKLEEGLANGELDSEKDMDKFIEQIQMIEGDRYSGINFMNIGTSKNTIEFRTPNGTVNPDVWIENINLFGGIIKASQDLSIIQAKPKEELTDEEKNKLMYLNRLKDKDISMQDKLNALLSLTVTDKSPYIERFNGNIELLQKDEEIKETMQKAKLSKPLNIRKICHGVLTGDDAVRGEEVKPVESVFYNDINRLEERKKCHE